MNSDADKTPRKRIVFKELQKRTVWFIRLRWWVSPVIAAGAVSAYIAGFEFNLLMVLLVAGFILLYNFVFRLALSALSGRGVDRERSVQRFTICQVGFDYAAVFLLIHYSGGASSPLVFFFIFHIIFASILLPVVLAYVFAGLSSLGLSIMAVLEYDGILARHPVLFLGDSIESAGSPSHMFVRLFFFTASVFIAAFSTTEIMRMLRMRILALDRSNTAVSILNEKLNALYHMIQAVGSKQKLNQVLGPVCNNLVRVVDTRALSVKLLSESRELLKYAAACNLPDSLVLKNSIVLKKSPLNRRIIEGEPFVTGDISQQEMFQFGEDLEAAGFKSVLFVPLKVEGRVIGILGGYSRQANRFTSEDVGFFQQAADLVAMAIENARAYENIEKLMQERTRFMLQVAHNLKAPLDGAVSILNLIQEGYLGDLKKEQSEYLTRVSNRAGSMRSMITELLTLARSRSDGHKIEKKSIDLKKLLDRIERTFRVEAGQKGLTFMVDCPYDIPAVSGDWDMLEQMMENLVSNAIKYTPKGSVWVDASIWNEDRVRIMVADTGIGITQQDMPGLFSDFFRAGNAKTIDEIGTGLGLAIVRETVEKHMGSIKVDSEPDRGSVFTVYLPIEVKMEREDENSCNAKNQN